MNTTLPTSQDLKASGVLLVASPDFVRLRWHLRQPLEDAIAVLASPVDPLSTQEPYTPHHPVASRPATDPPVSRLRVTLLPLDRRPTRRRPPPPPPFTPDAPPPSSSPAALPLPRPPSRRLLCRPDLDGLALAPPPRLRPPHPPPVHGAAGLLPRSGASSPDAASPPPVALRPPLSSNLVRHLALLPLPRRFVASTASPSSQWVLSPASRAELRWTRFVRVFGRLGWRGYKVRLLAL